MRTSRQDSDLTVKQRSLEDILRTAGKVAVAFSGGVDSTFLLAVACKTLGKDSVLAVTATGPVYTRREHSFAETFAQGLGVTHLFLPTWDLSTDGPYINQPDRCFKCKSELFGKLVELARQHGFAVVADGTNASDLGDYRPGLRALKQLSIRSPLMEAGLTKDDIRALSREMGLPTWDRPAMACLGSRFPYGAAITERALRQVEYAEECLSDMGFRHIRVRHHGDMARIEVPSEDIPQVASKAEQIVATLKGLGYKYVALDLQGYRTGSMNETLSAKEKGLRTPA